jgi:putative transport protein
MTWLLELVLTPSIAGTIFVLGAVVAAGLVLGSFNVLFTGLAASWAGWRVDAGALHFARDFGLILFVFAIGTQIGPGFFASLRQTGLKLNLLAAGTVIAGTLIALALAKWAHVPGVAAVGLLSGATTNTPSLAAAQSVLHDAGVPADTTAAGYALAYPMGVIGTILTLMLVRRLGPPRRARSAPVVETAIEPTPRVERVNLEVTNPNLEHLPIRNLPLVSDGGIVITRHLSGQTLRVPAGDERLKLGDVLLAVGPADRLDQLRLVVGRETQIDLRETPSNVVSRRLLVTRREPSGRTLRGLALRTRFGVNISRVQRAGVEMTPGPDFALKFADSVTAVGPEDRIKEVAALLGNTPGALDHIHLIPMFIGIALGILVGMAPIHVPGLSFPVRIGLAGGPLIVAIAMARAGMLGPLICYVPRSANFALRELGIALFLACVGLSSGPAFAAAVTSASGLAWFAAGTGITMLPLLCLTFICRTWVPVPSTTVMGVLAGCMTDPPALAYASATVGNDEPATAYATVYPMTMLLRIVCAQVLVALVL